MNCTADASVFVAAVRLEEEHYAASRRFLQQVRAGTVIVLCPSLVLRLVSLDLALARRAAQIAMTYRLVT